jgi:eukaryotic-like serine/threonine-protein kinase
MLEQTWLDALPYGIFITDAGLHLVQVNQWLARRLPGLDQQLGRPLAEAMPELSERSLLAAFELTLQQGCATVLPTSLYGYILRLAPEAESGLPEMPQSATIVPLWEAGAPCGTLTVIEDVSQRLLTERQLEREIVNMTALHEVDRALATLDLQDCLQTIVDRTSRLFAAEAAALFLIDGDRLVAAAVSGVDAAGQGRSMPIGNGIVGWAATHHEPVLVPDVVRDGRYFAFNAQSRAEMAAPLLLHGGCLGVINVESSQVHAFNAASLEMLELLAARAAAAIHNARLHAAEHEQRTLADTLRNIGLSLAAELNLDAILDTLLDHVARVVPYDTASVMLLDADSGRVRMARHRGYERFGVQSLIEAFDEPLDRLANLAHMAEAQQPQVVPRTRDDPRWRPTSLAAHIQSWAGAPILARGRLLGMLSLDKTEPGFYTQELAERLAAFAAQAGLAMENARLYAEQQQLAVTDSLTGISNRRHFDQELTRELQRSARFNRSTALVMMDLDDFKSFNDRFGHPTGDEALRSLGRVLQANVRGVDTAARYGGEEFVVILPESNREAACHMAERLRAAVAALPLRLALGPAPVTSERVTISLGVALVPQHADTPAGLVRAADMALYAAKRDGKNRVALFDGPALDRMVRSAPPTD